MIVSLTEDKTGFLETIIDLKREVNRLNVELEKVTKSLRMLNSGIYNLDNILIIEKTTTNMKGLGYTHGRYSS